LNWEVGFNAEVAEGTEKRTERERYEDALRTWGAAFLRKGPG